MIAPAGAQELAGYPGAQYLGDRRTRFRVWAPRCRQVEVQLVSPYEKLAPLAAAGDGCFAGVLENIEPGCRYFYRLDGELTRPDPASRWQPEGVGGPSAVVEPFFAWSDSYWCGLPLSDLVIYELHVGTFTPEGTFAAAAERLKALRELGVTGVELMPVAQFPGTRNWGYDGVFPWAVQHSYGGPEELKRFVNACHREGLAAVLDAVYNHIGPEGSVLEDFGPYLSERYRTPWGAPFNLDGADSDPVRRFFLDNALYWLEEFRFDALRLDAVSSIVDASARPFLSELGAEISALSRRANRLVYAIAESSANDPRTVRARELGGLGLDAQWNFDFHHALHAALTGERAGYYQDYGSIGDLAKAYGQGFVFTGQRSAYWRRAHGGPPEPIPPRRLVVYAQNHDEVGNRPRGERFGTLVSTECQKLAAAFTVLAPGVPLLFMGEEYGEIAPFEFFIEHADAELRRAVCAGRRAEAREFGWDALPDDPALPEAFMRAKLDWELREKPRHRTLLEFYKELLRLRRTHPALKRLSREHLRVEALEDKRALFALRQAEDGRDLLLAFCFGDLTTELSWALPEGRWHKLLESAAERWGGTGERAPATLGAAGGAGVALALAPRSATVYERATG